jgi:hypothetical protein
MDVSGKSISKSNQASRALGLSAFATQLSHGYVTEKRWH